MQRPKIYACLTSVVLAVATLWLGNFKKKKPRRPCRHRRSLVLWKAVKEDLQMSTRYWTSEDDETLLLMPSRIDRAPAYLTLMSPPARASRNNHPSQTLANIGVESKTILYALHDITQTSNNFTAQSTVTWALSVSYRAAHPPDVSSIQWPEYNVGLWQLK